MPGGGRPRGGTAPACGSPSGPAKAGTPAGGRARASSRASSVGVGVAEVAGQVEEGVDKRVGVISVGRAGTAGGQQVLGGSNPGAGQGYATAQAIDERVEVGESGV